MVLGWGEPFNSAIELLLRFRKVILYVADEMIRRDNRVGRRWVLDVVIEYWYRRMSPLKRRKRNTKTYTCADYGCSFNSRSWIGCGSCDWLGLSCSFRQCLPFRFGLVICKTLGSVNYSRSFATYMIYCLIYVWVMGELAFVILVVIEHCFETRWSQRDLFLVINFDLVEANGMFAYAGKRKCQFRSIFEAI